MSMNSIHSLHKRYFALPVLLFSVFLSHAQGNRQQIEVMVDGENITLPFEIIQDGKITTWDWFGQLTVGGEDGAVLTGVQGLFDPDPFIGYAIGLIDIGAPSSFLFSFATPIVPTSPPGTVSSSFSAALTDAGDGAISITPPAVFGVPTDSDGIDEIHVVNDGFPLTNDGLDLGPAGVFGGGASVHGPFNEVGPMPGPGAWTWMQIDVGFTGSGGGDLYGLTGSAIKTESEDVPEAASTLFLALIGLGGCAAMRGRLGRG